ncbi:factor-independent urate hydroxylase [Bradyrhizobium prioriisuperbiae]|uniref:factor-independent urate hydroxylase n=1 Tax=Bradyrhizobium prioriisuperbiae TaxID=2854389 RepID=UPI0028E6C0F7|nr:urate oxidase [Bradyrhizobium prioritasuperba]
MALVQNKYGKGRVRVMRINKSAERHEVSELTVKAMIEGDFSRAYTHADNATCISTDTVKNVVNVVARENLALSNELFCQAVAKKLFDSYPQVSSVKVSAHETKWTRLAVGGKPHAHSFLLDGNGKPSTEVSGVRGGEMVVRSGIDGFTFMKTTESGWASYAKDPYTTIPETHDRMCATSMEASWRWRAAPQDYAATNAKILDTMLEVFATTYSASVQDSLYRMGEAALAAVPEIQDITMACPNKHYLLINLSPFGLDNNNQVFLPTDEPHGQIECTVGR